MEDGKTRKKALWEDVDSSWTQLREGRRANSAKLCADVILGEDGLLQVEEVIRAQQEQRRRSYFVFQIPKRSMLSLH